MKNTIGLILALAVALAACATPTATTVAPTEPSGGEATATSVPSAPPQGQAPISKDIRLDPANAEDADSILINGYIYEGLVKLESGAPSAALAASWIVSDDGLTYTFNLRPGVVFQDGTPLDADAVLANFNRWFDPADPLRGSGAYNAWKTAFLGFKGEFDANGAPVSSFDGIEKAGNLTVLVHLNRQVPDLLTILAQPAFALVSPAALTAQGDKFGTSEGGAVGTGPYAVGEWTADKLVLQPNASYWGTPPAAGLEFPLQ